MRSRVHVLSLVLFAASLLYNVVVWGGTYYLADVGTAMIESAQRESPLAATYIAIGGVVDRAIPSLGEFGASRLTEALGAAFKQVREDPVTGMAIAFGASWNVSHTWLKTMYWSTPVFLLLAVVSWARRPKQVRSLRR
ncbi:MAG: hypothetical protein ABW186_07075 [Rhodanobacteraceae bacterium]